MRAVLACIAVIGCILPAAGQDMEATRLLAEAQRAIGLEAHFRIVSLSFSGRLVRELGGRTLNRYLDVYWVAPDKYVRVSLDSSGPFETTMRDGFNGDAPIREVISALPIPGDFVPGPQTPERLAAARREQVLSAKRSFARWWIALFPASPEAFLLEFTYAGTQDVNGTRADAIDAKGRDGQTLRLFLDATTHLPLMVSWRAKMIATFSTSSIVTTRGGQVVSQTPPAAAPPSAGQAPPGAIVLNGPPSGDPTAGLPLVEHQLFFTDYKKVDGLMWPHRLRETVEGQLSEETRIEKYKLNPKIPADCFKVVEK